MSIPLQAQRTAVLFGYGQFGCVAFEALRRAGVAVRLVVTYRDRAEENCWQSLERMATHHLARDDGHAGAPGTILPGNQVACGTGVLGVVGATRANAGCHTLPNGHLFHHQLETRS
jgi:hypothetical protein